MSNIESCLSPSRAVMTACCYEPQHDVITNLYYCDFEDEKAQDACQDVLTKDPSLGQAARCFHSLANPISSASSKSITKTLFLMLLMSSLCLARAVNMEASTSLVSRDACVGSGPDMIENYMTLGFYSDKECEKLVKTFDYTSAPGECPAVEPNTYYCFPASLEPDSYARVLYASRPHAQLTVTQHQNCLKHEGANGVLMTFNAGSNNCVHVQGITGDEGAMVWPEGGSGISKRQGPVEYKYKAELPTNTTAMFEDAEYVDMTVPKMMRQKRKQECSGFTTTSSENILTRSVQVSSIVNCRNAAAPCSISSSIQHSSSLASSYNLDIGIKLEWFDVRAQFGRTYTDTETTTTTETFSIEVDQIGYLTTYSSATLFKGTYTGCQGIDGPTEGEVIALHENGLTYSVVLTNGN